MPGAVPDAGAGEAEEGLRLPEVIVMVGWGCPAAGSAPGLGSSPRRSGGRAPPAAAGQSPRRWTRCPPRRQAAPLAPSPLTGCPRRAGAARPPDSRSRTLRGLPGPAVGSWDVPGPLLRPPSPVPSALLQGRRRRRASQALSHPGGAGVWPRSPEVRGWGHVYDVRVCVGTCICARVCVCVCVHTQARAAAERGSIHSSVPQPHTVTPTRGARHCQMPYLGGES